jgi:squalene-associated FAD-dependent desaturase
VPALRADAAPRVAVIGAGWAGCACAVVLAKKGLRVSLLEQSRSLGGRARGVTLEGVALDNGQHLLIGAFRRTLGLIERVHPAGRAPPLFRRFPLTLRPFGTGAADAVALRAGRLPAPFHLASAILTARGLTLPERLALVGDYRRLARAGFRTPAGQTVAQCFAGTPLRALAAVWEPLCIAALNTPPETASAQVFANVLRLAFAERAGDSDFLVPASDLTALFPEPAARLVTRHGGNVRTGLAVRGIVRTGDGISVGAGGTQETYDAAVVAVAPHQLAAALGAGAELDAAWRAPLAQVAALTWESITTVYLAYAEPVTLPLPMLRLDDAPGQWVFDRSRALDAAAPGGARALLAVVISTSGPHDAQDQGTLAAAADAQLRRLAGQWPLPVWSRVIAERRATYACTPRAIRPTAGRVGPGLYLAGDYTDADLPATLEAATRSGVAAARAVLADCNLASGQDGDPREPVI